METAVKRLPLPEVSLFSFKRQKPAKNYFTLLKNNMIFIEVIQKQRKVMS